MRASSPKQPNRATGPRHANVNGGFLRVSNLFTCQVQYSPGLFESVGDSVVSSEFEAASKLLASSALIVLVVFSLQNLVARGRQLRLGDLPAGALFGIISVAQMFQPIEPFSGFIFDLRNAPVALAGAFVGWRAAILAAAIAVAARFGIGGTGMWSGMLAICYATGAGMLWRAARGRLDIRPLTTYVLFGLMTASSLSIGLLLPDPVRAWFFANAAPVLAVVYLTILPLLAWVADRGIVLDSLKEKTIRAALQRKNIELLSLPALLHQVRLDALVGERADTNAMLCLRINSTGHLGGRHSGTRLDGLKEAVLLRIVDHLPEIRAAGVQDDRTLLIPLTSEQVMQLDRIRDGIRTALHSNPFQLTRSYRHWVSYELGLLSHDACQTNGHLVPRRIATCSKFDHSSTPARNPRRAIARPSAQVDISNAMDLLFQRADLLMNKAA